MRTVTLSERLRQLAQRTDPKPDRRGWQAIVGTFAHDPFYEEAMRLGQKWRASQGREILGHG